MLFICYFEIMPDKIKEVGKNTVAHSGHTGVSGIKVLFEGVSPTHWGIAAFEAESEEAVFEYLRPWAALNDTLQVSPALRVDNGEYATRFPKKLMD